MDRYPAVAGIFYSKEAPQLKEEIRACFLHRRGAGLPEGRKQEKILGGIVPHAGYRFSGPAATHFYRRLFESTEQPETLILLGPSHTSSIPTAAVWVNGDWLTPLGRVQIDKSLAAEISSQNYLEQNESVHLQEHSLEVQLPFIQFLYKTNTPKIVPIVISQPPNYEILKRIADSIFSVIKKKKTCILISSDFTHYGMNYGYIPFYGDAIELKLKLAQLDQGAIKKIRDFNVKAFLSYIKETEATICGAIPITVGLLILKQMGSKQSELLSYYTSGDITGDWENSVSYASLIFK